MSDLARKKLLKRWPAYLMRFLLLTSPDIPLPFQRGIKSFCFSCIIHGIDSLRYAYVRTWRVPRELCSSMSKSTVESLFPTFDDAKLRHFAKVTKCLKLFRISLAILFLIQKEI